MPSLSAPMNKVAGFAGIHDVVGKGADGLAELHLGVGRDGTLGAFVLGVFKEW